MSFLEKILVSAIRWQLPVNPSNYEETPFREILFNTLKNVYQSKGSTEFWTIIKKEVYVACQESILYGPLYDYFLVKKPGWYRTWLEMLKKGVEEALNFDPYWVGEIISALELNLSSAEDFWDCLLGGAVCVYRSEWRKWEVDNTSHDVVDLVSDE